MSWHFSRALVEEFSEAICLAGEQSAPSNTTPTPEAYYWPDKTTEHSRLSRFGMTSEPLTEIHGEELLTWFREASPVRTYPQPVKVRESTESAADYGAKWQGSFAKYSRDSSLWKTAQCSLLADSDEFSEIWPRWGSMRNGASYLRQIPALRTFASESGLWPTPTAMTATGGAALCKWGGSGARAKLRSMVTNKELNGPLNPEWVSWLMGWPRGWSSLTPLETAKFQEWQQQHSIF